MDNEYLDIIGLGIFKALNDKRYPILVNGKISESAIPTSITNSITSILSLIPDAASSENKLADKNFVNSSIATNTATFRGTFDDLATLQATSADINDYAFYVHTDEIGNTAYDRYKHNGSTWVFEYTLNNSSFTAEQWSAINSGITTTKVGNYDAHLINYSNPHKVTKSQVGLGNVENVALSSWAGSNKITTLGTITTGVWNGTKITNTYLANSSITIGTTAISLGSTAKSLAGIEKLQLNDANSNLVYDSTTGSWKLTGNLLVTGFISAGAKGNSSSGGGSTYTQREWAEIKIMSASEIGLLASAYSVKEAYNELNNAIETLAGKATNVKFTQTLTSGKQIGTISIDGKSTSLFAPANYAWSEVTGKPTFATVATSGSYADLTNKPTIASLMGSTAIGGTSSYLYWNGSAWATKALGSNAFTSISKVSQLTNDSGYITGITKAMVEGVLIGNITSHSHSNYVDLTSFQTITGNKKFSGSIQIGAIGINTENAGLYGYGQDSLEIHAENILTLCGEQSTYIGNADNSAMVNIQEDMAGYNAETSVETWYIYRDGEAYFKNIIGSLANSIAIKLNGGTTEGTNLFTFNNSASKTINITPSAIGAAAASHTHSYIPLSDKGLSNGKVSYYVNFPSHQQLVDLGYNEESTEINDEAYFKGLCKWAIDNFANQGQILLIGNAAPNSYGFCCIQLYSGHGKDATTGLPRYCSGTYISLDRATTNFSCINYIWTFGGSFYGNAASASKWATARTITLTGSVTGSVSIDGSADVSLVTTTNHTHSYLPLSGGMMSNTNVVTNLNADLLDGYNASSFAKVASANNLISLGNEFNFVSSAYAGEVHINYRTTTGADGAITKYNFDNGAGGLLASISQGQFSGNAASSSKWATPRTITLTGSVTGSVSIDGSQNVSLATTTNHTHTFDSLTSKPTTISGYGITDAYTKTQTDTKYLQLAGGTITGSLTVNGLSYFHKRVSIRSGSAIDFYDADGNNRGILLPYSSNNYALSFYDNTAWRTLLHSGNVGNYALPLSGGTLTGSVTMQGMNTNLIRNITYTSTSSWARGLINLQVDGISKFSIGALGDYTLGASDNGILYGFIGCNSYDGLNLRISATSLSWGDNPLLHSGNYNSYCPTLTGTGASGTWGISISGNAATVGGITGALIPSTDVGTGYWGSLGYGSSKKLSISANYGGVEWNAQNYCAGLMFGCDLDTHGFISIGYNSPIVSFAGSNNTNASNDNPNWYFKLTGTSGTIYNLNCAPTATKLANSRIIWGQSFDGTGNVNGRLELNGKTALSDDNGQSYIIFGNTTGAVYLRGNSVYLQYGVKEGLILNSSGNVGIGTNSPSYKLHIVGVTYASEGLVSDGYISAASTSTSSDIRLKDNISEISSETALKWLSMLKPKSWTWNSLAGVKGRSMGFVAQDIEGILPQMIRKRRDNDYLSLDYTQLHAIEVSALQSHEKRIEELERENKILKEELNKLKLNAN